MEIVNNVVGWTYISRQELRPFQGNLKKVDDSQNKKPQSTILKRWFDAPIYVWYDHDNYILDGHQRLIALDKLAKAWHMLPSDNIPIVYIKAETEKEAKEKILEYNSAYSDFDLEWLGEFAIGLDIEAIGIPELDKLWLWLQNEEEEDSIPWIPDTKQVIVERGDIFQLWKHRLVCGDATDIRDVELLMDGQLADEVVTDPPYNTGMSGKEVGNENQKDEKARLSHMFNDSYTDEEWFTFLHDTFTNYLQVTKGDCAFYVFIDRRRVQDIKGVMETIMDVKNVIVWDKWVHWLGSDYKYTYELCVVGKKWVPEISNRYGLDYQDIRRVQRDMWRNKDHATAKPIALLEKPIVHASKQDDIVLDLFGGSGSTLITSEKTNRRCYMMELEPKYIQVILKRYHQYTKWEGVITCVNRTIDLDLILKDGS